MHVPYRFFEDVVRREGLATLGLLDGDPYSIEDLGAVGQALQQAVTLLDAIKTFGRLVHGFAEGNMVWLERGAETSWLHCYTPWLERDNHIADHCTILPLIEIIRLAAGAKWRPLQIYFYSVPTRALEATPLVADIETRFLSETACIAFETELLTQPVRADESSSSSNHQNESVPLASVTTSGALGVVLQSTKCLGAF